MVILFILLVVGAIGVYFSEELKAVSKLGYQIALIKGYEFSKEYLFVEL